MRTGDSRLVVFDSPLRENLYPLSLTRPTFDFILGTRKLLENLELELNSEATDLIVPKYLEPFCKEKHPSKKVNEHVPERCIAVNALTSPDFPLASELKKALEWGRRNFALVDSSGSVIFSILDELRPEVLSSTQDVSGVEREVYSSYSTGSELLKFPWLFIEKNYEAINEQSKGRKSSNDPFSFEVLGSRLHLSQNAEIERNVTLDTRTGGILIDEGATIQSQSRLTGPCYIGKKSTVKSARIREGTTIGDNCKVSGELEASIFFEFTNKSHEGFVGHSIVGSWVNLGALTTNSDLKNTYGEIKMNLYSKGMTNTGTNKIGCFIADMAKTSIGSMIFSGKTIGVSSHVFGNVFDDVPSFTLYGKSLGLESKELYSESAIETQRRMMDRRKVSLTETYSELIKSVFKMTEIDRSAQQVAKGKFTIQ